ncbi:hypothetical protein S245_008178 [Arachis hypogaea]
MNSALSLVSASMVEGRGPKPIYPLLAGKQFVLSRLPQEQLNSWQIFPTPNSPLNIIMVYNIERQSHVGALDKKLPIFGIPLRKSIWGIFWSRGQIGQNLHHYFIQENLP